MAKLAFSCAALAAMLALLAGTPAAAVTKVWVSNAGNDGNPCTTAMPCLTFQHAHDTVAAGGEIGVLTPGDYGTIVVAKSVNITNDSTGEASVLVPSGSGIFVGAGAGDVVSVRGLVIDGQTVGRFGITLATAAGLHVQNCVLRNLQTGTFASGLWIIPGGNSQLFVSDTISFNNGNGGLTGGIYLQPQGTGTVNAVFDRVHLENNVRGLIVDSTAATSGNGSHVILRDSVVSGNVSDGILALTGPGAIASFISVERTSSVNNGGSGIAANGAHATVLLGRSTLTRNGAGVTTVNSGQLISYGNNKNNNNIGPEGTATFTFTQF